MNYWEFRYTCGDRECERAGIWLTRYDLTTEQARLYVEGLDEFEACGAPHGILSVNRVDLASATRTRERQLR